MSAPLTVRLHVTAPHILHQMPTAPLVTTAHATHRSPSLLPASLGDVTAHVSCASSEAVREGRNTRPRPATRKHDRHRRWMRCRPARVTRVAGLDLERRARGLGVHGRGHAQVAPLAAGGRMGLSACCWRGGGAGASLSVCRRALKAARQHRRSGAAWKAGQIPTPEPVQHGLSPGCCRSI